jgi:hypothetical protein
MSVHSHANNLVSSKISDELHTVQVSINMLFQQFNVFVTMRHKAKGKAIPLQAWTGLSGSRRLRLPEFLDNQHMKVGRL